MQDNPSTDSLTTTHAQDPAAPGHAANDVFIGPFGLRAGWSLLIYIVLVFLMISGVRAAIHRFHTPTKPAVHVPVAAGQDGETFAGSAIPEAIAFSGFLGLAWIMSRIERRRIGVYGLGGSDALPRFFTGAAWGLVSLSALVGVLSSCHFLVFDARLLHGPIMFLWGAKWLLVFLLVGLMEEFFFRGYIQYTLTRAFMALGERISPLHARTVAFWIAGLLTSALFAFGHLGNKGETSLGIVVVSLAGLVFCIALWRTGSLWWAIGFHTAWDWAQSFLWGVPDSASLSQGRLFATHAIGNPFFSGGAVGPEGSVFVIPTLALVIVVLFLTHPSPQPELQTLRAISNAEAPLPSSTLSATGVL